MSSQTQKDNSTFTHKAALRRFAMKHLDMNYGIHPPIVMETHGGEGKLYDACYGHVENGIVFEKDPNKIAILAQQRPTWAVYEADCVKALEAGAGAHLEVNLLDLDPYGSPFDVLSAFMGSERPRAEVLALTVNDGLRQKVQIGGGWNVNMLHLATERFGNNLYPIYLDVCRFVLEQITREAGYRVDHFAGYYCGHGNNMTHYFAVLRQGQ